MDINRSFEIPKRVFNGVLTPHLEFNILCDNTPIVYKFTYINIDDEKNFKTSISNIISNAGIASGGVVAELWYSSTLKNIINQICELNIIICGNFHIKLKLRIKSVELYEGNDICFPWLCGEIH